MASLQLTKSSPNEPQKAPVSLAVKSNDIAGRGSEMGSSRLLEKSPLLSVQERSESGEEPNWFMKKKVQVESSQLQFKPLEDDHIEQMIEELLDYGSLELSSVLPPQSL